MKAVFMCVISKMKRKRIPNLILGICILITTVLLVNAFILLRELNTIFDRAYEDMNGPQMCCLWSNEMFSTDTVRQYLDGWQEEMTYQITEKTKTIDYIEKDGVKLSNGILLELPEAVDCYMLFPKMSDGEMPEMLGENEIWITTKPVFTNFLQGDMTGNFLLLHQSQTERTLQAFCDLLLEQF